MTRRRQAITERVPTTPRKVVVYTDNLMTSNGARNTTAQESYKELEHSMGVTLNTALVISTSYRFDPELNMLEILDPHNPRNNVEVKGITNYQVSVKLFILPAAVDANRRPSPLYVKQALTCIRKQLGAVTIDELFISFADETVPATESDDSDSDSNSNDKDKAANSSSQNGSCADGGANDSANGSADASANGSADASVNGSPNKPESPQKHRHGHSRHSQRTSNDPRDGRGGGRGQKPRSHGQNGSAGAGDHNVSGEEGSGAGEPDADDMSRYLKIWRLLSRIRAEGDATKIGICDVNKNQLDNLCQQSGVVPDMVQIRVDDCDFSPAETPTAGEADDDDDDDCQPQTDPQDDDAKREMREYALKHGISVRSHSDSQELLSNATFQALAADYRINERFPTTEVPPEGYKIDLMRPRWVANYNVTLRNRGLIANRGYIVMASSDCVLDPNRLSRFGYSM